MEIKDNNADKPVGDIAEWRRPFKEIKDLLRHPKSFDELVASPQFQKVRGSPQILDYRPKEITSGSNAEISGRNLKGAKVMIGNKPAEVVLDDFRQLTVCVPGGILAGEKVDLLAWNQFGHDIVKDAFLVLPARRSEWYTFSAPQNIAPMPSKTDQRYLALMVLPSDKSLPQGLTEADMHADLATKLSGPGRCANGFWQEASFGKTSFVFDIYDKVIKLKDKWYDYYHPAEPARIDASGANYPVKLLGGETLDVSGKAGFSAAIDFSAGNHYLSDIIKMINDSIDKAHKASGSKEEVPIVARDNKGQLRLETTEAGSGAILAVKGGTAVSLLGLDNATVTPGVDRVERGTELFEEALEKRISGMNDADAQNFLNQYSGIIVSHAVSETIVYLRATGGIGSFNVRGVTYTFGDVYITCGYPWETFAHEIGHNLNLPDLYDEPGDPELIGVELDRWDIMDCSSYDCHPSAWTKSWPCRKPASTEAGYNDPWMTAIEVITPPPPDANKSKEVLLFPTSLKIPPINPFAASHPGLPLVHALRLQLDPNHNIFVEARERGSFSNPTLGSATYDSQIPDEGVIVTDAINDFTGIPIYRAHAILLTPYNNPINSKDEEHVEPLTVMDKVKIKCKEVIGSDPTVYRIEVSWGKGSFFDLRIDPWRAPPWESPDIWIDTQVDNDWDEYTHSDPVLNPKVAGNPVGNGDRSRVGWPSRVYARVWNDGDTDAKDVQVKFSIVIPAGTGPGISIGSATIPYIKAGEFGITPPIAWTPRTDNEKHVCIQAEIIHQPGELNAINNIAQENVTDWYVEGSSAYQPVEFPFQVQNPLPRRAHFRLNARGLRAGYHVDVMPFEFWLDPCEIKMGKARLWLERSVPYEYRDITAPLISLEWQVLYGCHWLPSGGVSGWAHAVRKANLDVVFDPPSLVAIAQTAAGPIQGANITVRLLAPTDEVVLITRGKTNSYGSAQIHLSLPSGYRTSDEYRAEVLLSPTPGTGPADKEIRIKFGN